MNDFYDDLDDDLMEQVRLIHVTFVEAAEEACKALRNLLCAIDHDGTLPDAMIERLHDRETLEAFKRADKAYQNLECFLPEDTD